MALIDRTRHTDSIAIDLLYEMNFFQTGQLGIILIFSAIVQAFDFGEIPLTWTG